MRYVNSLVVVVLFASLDMPAGARLHFRQASGRQGRRLEALPWMFDHLPPLTRDEAHALAKLIFERLEFQDRLFQLKQGSDTTCGLVKILTWLHLIYQAPIDQGRLILWQHASGLGGGWAGRVNGSVGPRSS